MMVLAMYGCMANLAKSFFFLFVQDGAHVSRLVRLSDAVIHLESFAGSDKEQNPLYREYHGIVNNCIYNIYTVVTTCT